MMYLSVFWTFFKIGLFNFGGGYAMITFIQNEVVLRHGWLSVSEFTDIVAISQITPGPIGINLATYTGYTVTQNVWGAALATFAVCLPSFLLMVLISKYLLRYRACAGVKAVFCGLRPAVVGLIAAAALLLCNADNFVDDTSFILFAGAFMLTLKWKKSPILVILLAGAAGYFLYP